MLARAHRLTRAGDFATAVRRGRRAGTPLVVVHLWLPPGDLVPAAPAEVPPPRAGFVVGRAVGDAVTRNRVKRRLRHLVREELPALPAGALLVVRALPASAHAGADQLGEHLDDALIRLRRPREPR